MRRPPATLPPCLALAAMLLAAAPLARAKDTCHALLIGGMPGTPIHARHYRDWLKRFHAYLTKTAGVPAANVTVLSGDKDFTDPLVTGLATGEAIEKAFARQAAGCARDDQFVLFLVGLGTSTGKVPLLVLPGRDVDARQLADWLGKVPAANQVVLNFLSASGDFTPVLSAEGRVVVCANMPSENAPPVYPEFFLRGLESRRADGRDAPAAGKKDGVITVLEAYHWAAWNAAQWIARQHKAGENAWRLDGRESVAIFRKLYVGRTGEDGARLLDPASDASAPDRPVRLKIEGKED